MDGSCKVGSMSEYTRMCVRAVSRMHDRDWTGAGAGLDPLSWDGWNTGCGEMMRCDAGFSLNSEG